MRKKVYAANHSKLPNNENIPTKGQSKTALPSVKMKPCLTTSLQSRRCTKEEESDTSASIEPPIVPILVKSKQANSVPSCDGDLPITSDNDMSWNFIADLKAAQVSLSEFLHTDFSKFYELNSMIVEENNNGSVVGSSTSSLQEPPLFSEESIMKAWAGDGL